MINKIKKIRNKYTSIFDCTVLTLIFILTVIILTRFTYAYGSSMDWCSQHYVFPQYFRDQFYETGDLFPDFAPNIGCGENIYYLSYYGLFSPYVLLSYLFPFMEMNIYIQIISIITVWGSVMLFYRFMKKRFVSGTAFISSLLYLMSPPLVFQSHRHIMFVCYMPFLILALESVDLMIKRGIKIPLIVTTALIIFSNYFFSVPAILAVTVYAVYSYLKHNKNFLIRDFMGTSVRYILCIFTAVMISAILILPTFSVLLNGRETTNSIFSFKIFIPFSAIGSTGLTPYSIGMSVFGMFSVISAVMSKGDISRRFLGAVLSILLFLPISIYILNGGMYLNGKVLIPFLPLLLIVIAQMYDKLKEFRSGIKARFIILLIFIILTFINYIPEYDITMYSSYFIFAIDAALFIVFFFLYIKLDKKILLTLSMTLTVFITFIVTNLYDKLIPIEIIKEEQNIVSEKMLDIISADDNIVRSSVAVKRAETPNIIYGNNYYSPYIYSSLHNRYYNNFYLNIIQNENEYRNSVLTTCSSSMLFNIFIGNKYLVTRSDVLNTGYDEIYKQNKIRLCKNKYALPIGRSSDKLISRKIFEGLPEAQKMEALVNCIVTDTDDDRNDYISTCSRYDGIELPECSKIKHINNIYTIESDKNFSLTYKLKNPIPKNKLLIVFMDIENLSQKKDARIRINSVKNTLTSPNWIYCNNNSVFSYVLSSEENEKLENLNYVFSCGEYKINNIRAYTIDYPDNIRLTGEFKYDKNTTKGNIIKGSINCSNNDSYFLITIPYDNGFTIYVDSKKQDYELTNCGFIGFPLKKGDHEIHIKFNAPLKNVSIYISAAGIIIALIILIFSDRKKFRKKI